MRLPDGTLVRWSVVKRAASAIQLGDGRVGQVWRGVDGWLWSLWKDGEEMMECGGPVRGVGEAMGAVERAARLRGWVL